MWPIICTYLYIVAAIVFYLDCREEEKEQTWHWILPVVFWPIVIPVFMIWYLVSDGER